MSTRREQETEGACVTSGDLYAPCTVGVLVVSAWSLSRMLEGVGQALRARGFNVVWLVESRLAEAKYGVRLEGGPKLYFTDWVRDRNSDSPYTTDVDWLSMFPLVDRSTEFGSHRWIRRRWRRLPGRLLGFLVHAIRRHKINLLVHENVSNAFAYFGYHAARKVGIPYFGIASSRLPGRFEVWRDPYGVGERVAAIMGEDDPTSSLADADREAVESYLNRAGSVPPDYMINSRTSLRYSYLRHYLRKVGWIPRAMRFWLSRSYDLGFSYKEVHPFIFAGYQVRRNMIRRLRLGALSRLTENPVPEERYFLYPLHFHPEASTSVQAPYYVDEDAVVKAVSLTLPDNHCLYVKEHPNAAGYKPLAFYRRIAALPNVRLIHWDVPVPPLIRRSTGVITLTSTMGYEALLMGKPVILLGRVFYSCHPLCWSAAGYSEVALAAHEISEGRFGCHNQDSLVQMSRRFVAAYWRASHPGRVLGFEGKGDDPDPSVIADAVIAEWRCFQSEPP